MFILGGIAHQVVNEGTADAEVVMTYTLPADAAPHPMPRLSMISCGFASENRTAQRPRPCLPPKCPVSLACPLLCGCA